MRMSAGCVQIGGGFAHVAETQKDAPNRDAMSGWGQVWLGADDLDEGRGHVNPEPSLQAGSSLYSTDVTTRVREFACQQLFHWRKPV